MGAGTANPSDRCASAIGLKLESGPAASAPGTGPVALQLIPTCQTTG